MVRIMGILNLTPDSFWFPSRYNMDIFRSGADIVDIGAVSTRPGAAAVGIEEEWSRLEPVLRTLDSSVPISIDTTSSEIVRRAFDLIGPFTVNDISAGEDDPEMLTAVGRLGLDYIAMHKRGNSKTMDAMCDYPHGVMAELMDYFRAFSVRAKDAGIRNWILDPGLGFAKTPDQCWEIIENLEILQELGRPILVGASEKRFTRGDTEKAHMLSMEHGADILRVHDVEAAIAQRERAVSGNLLPGRKS